MEIVFPKAHATDAAPLAVELAFGEIVVVEAAGLAEILPERDATLPARGCDGLAESTAGAHDLLDGRAVQLVRLFGVCLALLLHLIVAVAAPENLAAAGARTHQSLAPRHRRGQNAPQRAHATAHTACRPL